jgi:hypothetical protein
MRNPDAPIKLALPRSSGNPLDEDDQVISAGAVID